MSLEQPNHEHIFINLLAEYSHFLQYLGIKALTLRPQLTLFMIKYVIQAKKNEVNIIHSRHLLHR